MGALYGAARRDPYRSVALCSLLQRRTCLIDGDTGRDNGERWRLISIDTPELSEPECENEKRLAFAARDRLRTLLTAGYRIRASGRHDPHGRSLVDIELADGRDVSRILLTEGLAQKWPNRGNIWCDRYTGSPSRPRGEVNPSIPAAGIVALAGKPLIYRRECGNAGRPQHGAVRFARRWLVPVLSAKRPDACRQDYSVVAQW